MRRTLLVFAALFGVISLLPLLDRPAHAQATVSSGCKANCTFTGTTTASTLVADTVTDTGGGLTLTGTTGNFIALATGTTGTQVSIADSPAGVTISSTLTASTISSSSTVGATGYTCSGATHCGTKTLSAGSGTVTVVSGCHAICTDTTAAAAVKCSVSATTLTITGTSTDVINYFCF